MAERTNSPEDTVTVGALVPKPMRAVKVGKAKPIMKTALRMKVAFPAAGSTALGLGGNYYSPELSTDFLELPQSIAEQRNFYRFFYDHDPFVGQAVDLHTDLPLSKIRLRKPKGRNEALCKKSLRFHERWARQVGLLHRLMEIIHEYHLIGEVYPFIEDTNPEMPEEVTHHTVGVIPTNEDEELREEKRERPDAKERMVEWLNKNYKGFTKITLLPPDQVQMQTFPFTDEILIELLPDSATQAIVEKAMQGDPQGQRIVDSMPPEVVEYIKSGMNIPLNTDSMGGSFVTYLARKKSPYEPRGKSILQRCLRLLIFRDKVRQSLTSISSRHMTPYRLVWAEDMDDVQVEELREQVDYALMDPDYSIVTNFQVNWEEMGADQRLPDWSWVFDMTDRQLYAGLGVTESLLSGESSYSGDRINLEVINTRYMLLREILQDFVERQIFEPMCRRMGFVEVDEDGHENVLVPRLSFTRLALRDNAETFDALYNLYSKGSLPIDTILEVLNIDPDSTREALERDLFTVNDATFNEVLRGMYSRVGDAISENSDAAEKIASYLGLSFSKEEEGGGRFASTIRKKASKSGDPVETALQLMLKGVMAAVKQAVAHVIEQEQAESVALSEEASA